MQTTMEKIATHGFMPVSASVIPAQPLDARMAGNLMAQEVMAYAKGTTGQWHTFAWRLIDGDPQFRAAFITAIDNQKKAMRKEVKESGYDAKESTATVNSFVVQVSRLTGIARAFNGAATVRGLIEYANSKQTRPERRLGPSVAEAKSLGYDVIYRYAVLINGSAGSRAPEKPWMEKLGKFLETNKPSDEREMKEYETIFNDWLKLRGEDIQGHKTA